MNKEKNYIILSMIKVEDGTIFYGPDTFNRYWTSPRRTWIDASPTNEYIIHSVKRLNDGQVFKLGDKVRMFGSNNPKINAINLCASGNIQLKGYNTYDSVLLQNALHSVEFKQPKPSAKQLKKEFNENIDKQILEKAKQIVLLELEVKELIKLKK